MPELPKSSPQFAPQRMPGGHPASNRPGQGALGGSPAPPQPGFRDARNLFIAGAVSGTALVGFMAIYQWLAPWLPLMLALGIAVFLSALIGFGYCEQGRKAAFIKGLGICVIIALPTAAWGLGTVRTLAVQLFAQHFPDETRVRALSDGSREVRVEACTTLGVQNEGATAYNIVSTLFDTPAEGVECINRVAEVDPPGAARLRSEFWRRWELALDRQDAALVCRVTPAIFSVHTSHPPTLGLTECVANNMNAEKATCCAEALTARYSEPAEYVADLGDAGELNAGRRQRLFSALLPYAFSGMDASRREFQQFESTLMRTAPGRDWVLSLGCDGVLNDPNAQEFVDGLEAVSSHQGCVDGEDGGRSTSQWKNICTQWAAPAQRSADLCAPIAAETRSSAVVTASALVHKAIGAFFAQIRNAQIALGVSANASQAGEMNDVMGLMNSALAPSNLPGGIDPRLRHAARGFQGNHANYARILQQYTTDNKLPDGPAMVQQLQEEINQNRYRWSDLKKHTSPGERQQYQEQVDDAYDKAVKSGIDSESPMLDILR
ncbi:hypothetical protein [Bradymonas sediminis]|uniref:Uncharacterized protein n=1 Tax=Bradymonas sediminis TaxID=1548548 RepID=A0A2Z4FMK6_9DELT|nr:hypothetical protein [Bradymonas sediminis]AWV90211.1 hypothetical protein DN745_13050 [Bradymonas sediminis]TDP75821.1 hypothetical protein DFR33_103168 [Bradymonas sediminis]